jgi:enoyl-CoA hydratase/carnithine racemase
VSVDPAPGEVSVVKDGRGATVTWSRPARKNAFDSSTARRVATVLGELADDEAVSVVVLRPGGPVFCAGWDLGEIAAARDEGERAVAAVIAAGRQCLDALDAVPATVVIVLEGRVLGFGVSMLAHGDFVLMSDDSLIALPEMQHGIVPAAVLGDIAPVVGRSRAMNWALSGVVPAQEALDCGLVTRVVPSAEMDSTLGLLTERLGAVAPDAVRATKRLMAVTADDDRRRSQERGDAAAVAAVMASGSVK